MEEHKPIDVDEVVAQEDPLEAERLPKGYQRQTKHGILTLKEDMTVGFRRVGGDIEASPHVEGDVISGIGVATTKDDAVQDLLESIADRCSFFSTTVAPSRIAEDMHNDLGDLFSLSQ